jgi:nucleoside phosphorylase
VGPDHLILTGICFGLREDRQRMGDILVANQLRVIDHKKVVDAPEGADWPVVEQVRGAHAPPSVLLLGSFVSAQADWTGQDVHFGTMLSANTLLNSPAQRAQLIKQHPDAIGGEMEGAGVFAAAAKEKVDWIMVKAIADWGMAKDDTHHHLAARNAAGFVVHTIRTRALDPR